MADCPWYVTAHAVKSYMRILRRPVQDDGPEWDRAESELMELVIRTAGNASAGISSPKEIRPGLMQYRSPRPLRLGMLVATDPRPEGPLPQLVDVIPSNAGGGVGPGKPRKK